jgi:uncharacterized protein YqhQ
VTFGGQAVFDGVMMRGSSHYAVARRTPDGEIVVQRGTLPTWGAPLARVPFVRGLVALATALPLGISSIAPGRKLLTVAGLVGLSFVPLWAQVALIGSYVVLTRKQDALRRLFGYHGAEHKAVNALEAGSPLTVAAVQSCSTRHPRCGTSFLLVFLFVSFVTSQLFGSHLWLLPVVLAVATEIQRLDVFAAPGLALQRVTTSQPTDAQVEVAIAALAAVLEDESTTVVDPPSRVLLAS